MGCGASVDQDPNATSSNKNKQTDDTSKSSTNEEDKDDKRPETNQDKRNETSQSQQQSNGYLVIGNKKERHKEGIEDHETNNNHDKRHDRHTPQLSRRDPSKSQTDTKPPPGMSFF